MCALFYSFLNVHFLFIFCSFLYSISIQFLFNFYSISIQFLAPPLSPIQTQLIKSDIPLQIWHLDNGQWKERPRSFVKNDNAHHDWVRDVAWAPSLGLLSSTIASCSEDKTVVIWTEENNEWKKAKTIPFTHKVWRVSWSPMGNILAVSQGDNKVSLWKEAIDGEWKNLSNVDQNAQS